MDCRNNKAYKYCAGVQDAPLEMERNKAAARQSKVKPSTQLLLIFPPFPVGHPTHEHGITRVGESAGVVLLMEDNSMTIKHVLTH